MFDQVSRAMGRGLAWLLARAGRQHGSLLAAAAARDARVGGPKRSWFVSGAEAIATAVTGLADLAVEVALRHGSHLSIGTEQLRRYAEPFEEFAVRHSLAERQLRLDRLLISDVEHGERVIYEDSL